MTNEMFCNRFILDVAEMLMVIRLKNTPAKLCFESYNLLSTLYTTGRMFFDNI